MTNSKKTDHRKTVGQWFLLPLVWKIPVYQRHYAWDAADDSGPIHLFWDTVQKQTKKRLSGETPNQHYLGAVLVDLKTKRNETPTGTTDYNVVDGQQRLTTIQIAMLALIKVADGFHYGDKIKEKLRGYVFSEGHNPKLNPTNFDRKQFQTVLFDVYDIILDFGQSVSRENANKSKIVSTFEFFKEEFNNFVKEEQQQLEPSRVIDTLMDTLTNGFDIVLIPLNESDDAQQVFESLNSYARPLTTFDLIRNNVFYRAADKAEEFFNYPVWQSLEKPYWEEKAEKGAKNAPTAHIEAYIARMLVAKLRKTFRFQRNEIFKAYKEFSKAHSSIGEEIRELAGYAETYQYLDFGEKGNSVSSEFDFGVFRYDAWGNRDFYPVIFSIVGSDESVEEKQRMIKLLESYVIRRGACGLTTKNYNKHVVTICGALGDNPNYKSLHEVLKNSHADTTLFPSDDHILDGCVGANFYRCPFRHYVFEQIELSMHSLHAERVVVQEGQLTTDHILPQKWEKNEDWKNTVLGAGNRDDAAVLMVGTYIHTIGNLTLMSSSSNSTKSNRSLSAVKGMLSESTVKLNRDLAEEEKWNVEKIVARSKMLGAKICKIWSYDIL